MRLFLLSAFLFLCLPAFVAGQEWRDINNQAVEFFQKDDFDNAIVFGNRAIEQFKKDVGQENGDYAFLYSNLGLYLEYKGDFNQAVLHYSEAIRVYNAVFGKESEHHYHTYNGISYSYFQLGDFNNARIYTTHLVSTAQRYFGAESRQHEQALHRLAWVESRSGNVNIAETHFLQALSLREVIYGKTSQPYANLVKDIREFYANQRNIPHTTRFFELEAEVLSALHGATSNQHIAVLADFAKFLLEVARNKDEAFRVQQARIALLEQIHGTESITVMNVMVGIAAEFQRAEAYRESVYFHRKISGIVLANYDKENTNYAVSLLNLGYLQHYAGNFEEAIPNLKEANRIYIQNEGLRSPLTIQGLEVLTQVAEKGGFIEIALETNAQMLQAMEARFGKNHIRYTNKLIERALFYQTLDKVDDAIPLIKEAIAIESELDQVSSFYHQYFQVLGGMLILKLEYDDAEMYLRQGLSFAENQYGYGLQYAAILDMFFSLELARGNYLYAMEVAISKLDIYHETGGELFPKTIDSWNDLALIFNELQLSDQAITAAETAARLATRLYGPTHKETLRARQSLITAFEQLQLYHRAEQEAFALLDLYINTFGPTYPGTGIIYQILGNLFMGLHDFEQAVVYFKKSEEVLKEHQQAEFRRYANVLYYLAETYLSMRELGKSIEYAEKALEVRSLYMRDAHPDLIASTAQIAQLWELAGNIEHAYEWFSDAVEMSIYRNSYLHPNTAYLLTALANIYVKKNNPTQAIELLNVSIEIMNELYGDGNLQNLGAYNSLAAIYRDQGDFEQMDALNRPVLENHRIQSLQQLSFLTEKRQEQFFRFIEIYNDMYIRDYVRFVHAHPEAAERIMEITLFNKGLRLRSSSRLRETILRSDDTEILELYDTWVNVKNELQTLMQLPLSQREERERMLTSQAEELEQTLMNRSAAFRSDQEDAASLTNWRTLLQLLEPNEALIEFITYIDYNPEKSSERITRNAALVITKNAPFPHFIQLVDESDLDLLLDKEGLADAAFISGLYRQFGQAAISTAGQISRGDALFQKVWAPLEQQLNDIETVYISPSGTLNQIAFAAIPVDEDRNLLLDRYRFRWLSSSASLIHLKQHSPSEKHKVKIFGGIDYDSFPQDLIADATPTTRFRPDLLGGTAGTRGGAWNFLPGTLEEASIIYQLANEKGIQATLTTGNRATEEVFKQLGMAQAPDIIHIASHGFFFNNPEVDPVTLESLDATGTFFQQAQNPLHRSGILFAGANITWQGNTPSHASEDGVLTAYEVSNMFLNGTQLVVLSACETGLGDIRGSEGVFGLQRAFRMAGVERLLMSLWEVPDKETAEFMQFFYSFLFTGDDISEAFRKTQQEMRQLYPDDPFKWAAFVLLE